MLKAEIREKSEPGHPQPHHAVTPTTEVLKEPQTPVFFATPDVYRDIRLQKGGCLLIGNGSDFSDGTLWLAAEVAGGSTSKCPVVQFESSGTIIQQRLPRNASGVHYFDLSPLAGSGAKEIQFQIGAAKFREQGAKLLFWRNLLRPSDRVLVIAPHPDDAEIAAFGLYSTHESTIATLTTGGSGRLRYKALWPEPVEHQKNKGPLRQWDSLVIPQLGGVPPERCVNLGFACESLRELRDTPDQCSLAGSGRVLSNWGKDLLRPQSRSASWSGLIEDLCHLLRKVSPDVIVLPHPVLDGHPDHRLASLAVQEAAQKTGWQGRLALFYVIHAAHEPFWPYGRFTDLAGPPPWRGAAFEWGIPHSHPLSPETHRRKLMALESLHDVRNSDEFDVHLSLWRQIRRVCKRRLLRWRGCEPSYVWLWGRPNELFFTVTKDEFSSRGFSG